MMWGRGEVSREPAAGGTTRWRWRSLTQMPLKPMWKRTVLRGRGGSGARIRGGHHGSMRRGSWDHIAERLGEGEDLWLRGVHACLGTSRGCMTARRIPRQRQRPLHPRRSPSRNSPAGTLHRCRRPMRQQLGSIGQLLHAPG
jgi:hypothetical protein